MNTVEQVNTFIDSIRLSYKHLRYFVDTQSFVEEDINKYREFEPFVGKPLDEFKAYIETHGSGNWRPVYFDLDYTGFYPAISRIRGLTVDFRKIDDIPTIVGIYPITMYILDGNDIYKRIRDALKTNIPLLQTCQLEKIQRIVDCIINSMSPSCGQIMLHHIQAEMPEIVVVNVRDHLPARPEVCNPFVFYTFPPQHKYMFPSDCYTNQMLLGDTIQHLKALS